MSLTTIWVLLGLCSAASAAVDVLYQVINSSVTLKCECVDKSCQRIFWYRVHQSNGSYEYLLHHTSVDKWEASPNTTMRNRLQSHRSNAKLYTLTINRLQMEDTGLYSCCIKDQTEFPSYQLRVQEVAPTKEPPPPPKPTKWRPRPLPPCCFSYRPPEGCGKWILLPLLGGLVVLAVLLVAVLYYFSRLPKKCRHRFVKK